MSPFLYSLSFPVKLFPLSLNETHPMSSQIQLTFHSVCCFFYTKLSQLILKFMSSIYLTISGFCITAPYDQSASRSPIAYTLVNSIMQITRAIWYVTSMCPDIGHCIYQYIDIHTPWYNINVIACSRLAILSWLRIHVVPKIALNDDVVIMYADLEQSEWVLLVLWK